MALSTITKVSPTSQIMICKSVPFGRDYTGTILFDSYASQRDFLTKHAKYSCDSMKPFVLGQPIRVPYAADQLYECNYIYFTSQKSARHWCAFITAIERVNENVSDISYELDVLQNWQLEWEIPPCMVLREHVSDDTPGKNIQPEPLDTGDYVLNGVGGRTQLFNKWVVLVNAKDSETPTSVQCVGKVYNPLNLAKFDVQEDGTVRGIDNYLERLSTQPENIVSISMFPYDLYDQFTANQSGSKIVDLTSAVHYTNIDGYKARNFKLYTYPFNMLYCTDNEGNSATWRYEFFSENKYRFIVACAFAPNSQPVIAPLSYAGANTNWDEKLAAQPFPLCPYVIDTYRAYLAQNGFSIAASLAAGAGSIVSGIGIIAGSGGAGAVAGMGVAMSGVATIGNTLQDVKNHAVRPEQAKGSPAPETMFGMGVSDFFVWQKCITRDYAEAIDSFFDVYGYAVNKVKTPNLKSRPSWNYIKTENVQITGEIALADIEKLNSIFNRGVTFWHGDYVGDYSRSNK